MSPPGVPKARYGLPPRSAIDGDRVVRGRAPGRRLSGKPSSSQNIWPRLVRQNPRLGMVGELCNQPPLGVAEIIRPALSTTSRWQVSPSVAVVGSPTPADECPASALSLIHISEPTRQ